MRMPRESRFKWRHDSVLAVMVGAVRTMVDQANTSKPSIRRPSNTGIVFVPAGTKVPRRKTKQQPRRRPNVLDQAQDWEVMCDLKSDNAGHSIFIFPQDVVLTSAKPDLVVLSRKLKICIVWELTAPLEENIETRHSSKLDKYIKELSDNVLPGWTLDIVCGEVGAKGWVPPNFTKDLRRLFGFSKSQSVKLADGCSLVARKCSYVIWANRNNRDFVPFPMTLSKNPME
jgi:hypothetical protein